MQKKWLFPLMAILLLALVGTIIYICIAGVKKNQQNSKVTSSQYYGQDNEISDFWD